jgi:spore coat polysaccharide biosynthesis protein SpsF
MTGVVAIIQARIGSTRLPGKVLMDIGGKPMLARVMERAARAGTLDEIVVATTTEHADDRIVSLCEERGWESFRGSEADVLDRYYQAARAYQADHIVRITSDCPLIDPGVVDRVVREFLEGQPTIDYACNFLPGRTYPRGLDTEVMTFRALETCWKEDGNPAHREHVTQYILRHPALFRIHGVVNATDLSRHRWTVDTVEDLTLVRRIYDHFGDRTFSWEEVLLFLGAHPQLEEINRHVVQKVV